MLLCRVLGGNAKLCQAQDGRSSSAFSSLQTYQDPCSPTYQPMLAPATAPALAPYLAPGDPAGIVLAEDKTFPSPLCLI